MDKREKAELLYSAIGEIDEELILEAENAKKAADKRFMKPLLSVAAAILVLTVSITAIKLIFPLGSGLNGNYAPPPEGSDGNGLTSPDGGSNGGDDGGENSLSVYGATLTLLQKEESKYFFKLVITEEQQAVDVSVRGEGVDEWGNPIFVISTTREFAELTHIPKTPPKIFVNGEEVKKIPTEKGEYELVVDLSVLDEGFLWRNYFTVSPFGNIFR